MSHVYKTLTRAQLSYDYLHTNSTTHEFLFGALAELLDNARDASATKINIYSVVEKDVRGGFLLCFLDDGEGMDQGESSDIVTFGKSSKRSLDSQLIGMYGNGLKSGSMRIGNDLIVFSKKGPTMSCVFLSRTFHEEESIDEIIVPMPAFDSQTKKPLAKTPREREKHQTEIDLILKYSPFKTEAQFMKEFDKIEGASGTLVVIFNLKLLDNGESELDIKSDPYDIVLTNPEGGDFDSDEGSTQMGPRLMPERKSFRAYAAILYVDPRMRIYIQGKKVRTKRLTSSLYKPRCYKYSSGRFKTRSENESQKAQDDYKMAENRAREAESKARNLENKTSSNGGGTKEQRAELRKTQTLAAELRKDAQIKRQMADRKQKAMRGPKTLNFIFGVNIDNRNQDGMFVYNCSRLIKMYQKVGPQADGGVFCSGVVGVVDVPYLVLEPTHNKQDFADAKEYRHLQKAMGEHMVQYWKDLAIAQTGVTKFWENFGYISPNWRDSASMDPKFIRKRAMQVQVSLQCDLCLKWRILPFSANNIGKTFPDDWVCSMNPDPSHNRCSAGEEKSNIPEGILKKEIKSKEQKEKDLQEEIQKKQEQLVKMQKKTVVTSSRQLRRDEEEDMSESEEEVTKSMTRSQSAKVTPRSQQAKSGDKRRLRHASVSSPDSSSEDEEPVVKRGRPPAAKSSSSSSQKSRIIPSSSKNKKLSSSPSKTYDRRDSGSLRGTRPRYSTSEDDDDYSRRRGRPRKKDSDKRRSDLENGGVHSRTEPVSSEDVGTKVEVKSQGKFVYGVVTEVDRKNNQWRVKLDRNPQDRNDKWVEKGSNDVKLVKEQRASSRQVAESSGDQVSRQEASSSSAASQQAIEDIANGYRTCLRYFLPPQWMMDKEAVSTLTVHELAHFPLDDFFDHYEKGLRKLVSSFQMETETARNKLSTVRKMISKLLKSISEEFDIDPEADTEQVDELLALCVKQATQQQTSASTAPTTASAAPSTDTSETIPVSSDVTSEPVPTDETKSEDT